MNVAESVLELQPFTISAFVPIVVNRNAQALGRMARGVPKNYSPEEKKRRTEALVAARRRQARLQRAAKRALVRARIKKRKR